MPAGRMVKYIPKKRGLARRRAIRKARISRPLTAVARSQVYPFKRFAFKVTQGGTDNLATGLGLSFQLSDLPNYTEFTALFDQYKIGGIKYRWVVNRSPDYGGAVVSNVYNTAVQGTYPRIMWVHDYDSYTAPANFAELQQYPKMKEVYLTPDRPYTKWFFFKPARANVEFESGVNSAYSPTWKGFVDCASDTTPHAGIRTFYDGLNNNMQLRLECWYYLVFKNVR